jgi:hypothetical protein
MHAANLMALNSQWLFVVGQQVTAVDGDEFLRHRPLTEHSYAVACDWVGRIPALNEGSRPCIDLLGARFIRDVDRSGVVGVAFEPFVGAANATKVVRSALPFHDPHLVDRLDSQAVEFTAGIGMAARPASEKRQADNNEKSR